jgi:sulfite reductase (NADPH) hemoprotein beta-component
MTSNSAKTVLPAILLANDLLDGDVVFWTGSGWSDDPAHALVAYGSEQALALQEAATVALQSNKVVDAYLVDVTVSDTGLPVPNHFRERFKIRGPSNRPDLGKQARFDHLAGSLRDVSL